MLGVKFFYIHILLAFAGIAESTTISLDLRDRPAGIKHDIDMAFDGISRNLSDQNWVEKGTYQDRLSIDSKKYIHCLANQKQKGEIFVMDIGAGDGRWAKAISDYIGSVRDFPAGITVHIFNLIGEKGIKSEEDLSEIEQIGQCRIHNIFKCKIEELSIVLPKLMGKVDYINSTWAFRHFVDPVGTLMQTYDFLSPGSGLLSIDGFYFFYEGQSSDSSLSIKEALFEQSKNVLSMLKYMNVPFIFASTPSLDDVYHIIIKRKDANPCALPLLYAEVPYNERCYSTNKAIFKNGSNASAHELKDYNTKYIYANMELYNELTKIGALIGAFTQNTRIGRTLFHLRELAPKEAETPNYIIATYDYGADIQPFYLQQYKGRAAKS